MTGNEPSSHLATFHYIPPSVTAFDLFPLRDIPTNLILWIGGLGDTLGSVSYPFTLARTLPADWSLVQLILTSSGNAWGTTTLDNDVREMVAAVRYFRRQAPKRKIVLMGHSTGCQDSLHYVSSPRGESEDERPRVDGIILQAPVSDREALVETLDPGVYRKGVEIAQQYVKEGRSDDCLPSFVVADVFPGTPVTARRWLSLASPDGKGQDDYFSSDLPDERLQGSFGKIPAGTHVLFLFSGSDEHVPKHIRPEEVMDRWKSFAEGAGAIVHPESTESLEGASHNLNGSPGYVVDELCRRVNSFITAIDGQ
ncbi:Hypothetical protein D9617_14g075640 [Elsinoe fawcettii]|nr:Hypothetical protein D9617_14g075640 [Elsinoe fawcettii]